ncbi:MAG: ATP-binding cassette domain-containing protein [Planctomycetota bacterium]|nr:ATP-binding cassette domain-containing protein [Planctomycetota bacterium]
MDPVFIVEDLGLSLGGTEILKGLSFTVNPGERIAFLGPSGAGKTSLLRVLAGNHQPSSGHVHTLGICLSELKPAGIRRVRSQMGFVHQDLALVPNLRVLQNVLAGRLGRLKALAALRSLLWPNKEQTHRVFELLEELGIGDKLYERTLSLSGGEQQRVALARALYQDPRALLADEPVSAVDPARSRDLIRLMSKVAEDRKLPLLVSLHNPELAREFFPRLVGLRQGSIVFDLPKEQVTDDHLEALYRIPSKASFPADQRA